MTSVSSLHGPRADTVFALFYTVFVLVSFLIELPVCMGYRVSPTSPIPTLRASYEWCSVADRIFLHPPTWARVAVCMSATVFLSGYALLAYTFWARTYIRQTWLTTFGIAFAAVKLYGGALYMAANLLDTHLSPTYPSLFVLQSSSYMIVPALTMLKFATLRNTSTQRLKSN